MGMQRNTRTDAENFLKVARDFSLGGLPTEQRHPLTHDLANMARHDIPAALDILQKIDIGALRDVAAREKDLARLERAIRDTLAAGQRVFFYGCGATGRLSLSIEYLWRHIHRHDPDTANRVFGFMSGGDLALVHSIENFEDHPEFGARQVRDVGFGENDLLVSCTEGGETPSVIGATYEAARISSRKPFFLYCNPDDLLRAQVERSRQVLDDAGIEKICLYVGPMSLSGSTRLQASTALMLGAGIALMRAGGQKLDINDLIRALENTDLSFLQDYITQESDLYQRGGYVLYQTSAYGITILTDTTERAPTFSLTGFENQKNPARVPSLSYLMMTEAQDAASAWRSILLRDPVTIEWDELRAIAGHDRLMGFDFSTQALAHRRTLTAGNPLSVFAIDREGNDILFNLDGSVHRVNVAGLHPLFEHLLLKMIMNMHSTLVMGRIGRFESNVMTWVKPSNKKLIDRAIRYVQHLLEYDGITDISYTDICYRLFELTDATETDKSIVLKTVESFKKEAFSAPPARASA